MSSNKSKTKEVEKDTKETKQEEKSKKDQIIELYEQGYPVPEIVKRAKTTESYVHKTLSEYKTTQTVENTIEIPEKEFQDEGELLIKVGEKFFTPEELVMMFGKKGLDKLKKVVLEKTLRSLPVSIGKNAIDWILHDFETSPIYRDNPNELFNLIKEYGPSKLSTFLISKVVGEVMKVDKEYGHLLRHRVYHPPYGYEYPEEEALYIPPYPQQYSLPHHEPFYPPYPENPAPQKRVIPPLTPYDRPLTYKDLTKILDEMKKREDEGEDRTVTRQELMNILQEMKKQEEYERLKEENRELRGMLKELDSKLKEYEMRQKTHAPTDTLQKEIQQLRAKIDAVISGGGVKPRGEMDMLDMLDKIDNYIERRLEKTYELAKNASPPSGLTPEALELRKLDAERAVKLQEVEEERKKIEKIGEALSTGLEKLGEGFGRGVAIALKGEGQVHQGHALIRDNKIYAYCPNCKTLIQADEGASQISCPKCNMQMDLSIEGKSQSVSSG